VRLQMNKRFDTIAGSAFLVLGMFFITGSMGISKSSYGSSVGPNVFPFGLGMILVLLSVIVIYQARHYRGPAKEKGGRDYKRFSLLLLAAFRYFSQDAAVFAVGTYFFEVGLVGSLMGWALKRKKKIFTAILAGALPSLAIFFLFIFNPYRVQDRFYLQLDRMEQLFSQPAAVPDPAADPDTATLLQKGFAFFKKIFPAVNLVSTILTLFVIGLIIQVLGPRLRPADGGGEDEEKNRFRDTHGDVQPFLRCNLVSMISFKGKQFFLTSPSSSAEIAMQFWWDWLYTGDEAFLRQLQNRGAHLAPPFKGIRRAARGGGDQGHASERLKEPEKAAHFKSLRLDGS
jgi:putative tricarboxylic transport membrane protein